MEINEIVALIVGAVIAVIIIAYLVINQKAKIKEWLKFAVIEAERYLGGGTGQLKLRTVYDWFIEQFPLVAAIVPFPVFSAWVDIALDTMEEWLGNNQQVQTYVRGAVDEDSE